MMKKGSRRQNLVVGSWNVRKLVECSGDVRVCQKKQVMGERSEVVDRKLDLVVGEFRTYKVSICGRNSYRRAGGLGRMSG